MITTTEQLPNGEFVEVEWEIGEPDDEAGDGHVFYHEAEGTSGNHKFMGTAVMCDGEFVEMEYVEYEGESV